MCIRDRYIDVPILLDELVDYLDHTDDHPLLIAAIAHYQLVTIHPFEDGNGRTAVSYTHLDVYKRQDVAAAVCVSDQNG